MVSPTLRWMARVPLAVLMSSFAGAEEIAGEGAEPAEPAPLAENDIRIEPSTWLGLLPEGWPEEGARGVLYERWEGIAGSRVIDLTSSGALSRAADARGVSPGLVLPPGDGSAYGVRVRGHVVPPRSGKVRFVLSSDDNSELWLSSGEDPFARERVAWIAGEGAFGWTGPAESGKLASQWSAPVEVVAGRRYYFEAYHKERSGNDHFSLRWRFEGDKEVGEVPADSLHPWRGSPLDADDDGLPDAWQKDTGLYGLDGSGAWDDPDGDGVANFDEYKAGTNPLSGEPEAGFLLWETWHGVAGREVADLVRNPVFSGAADRAVFLRGSATPRQRGGALGSRISGYIVPKESGLYELAVSGDDSVELWFSPGGAPGAKRRVAFKERWYPERNWFVNPAQRSGLFELEAGRAYHVEILHKDAREPGWAGLAWRKEGEERFAEITPEFLKSPGAAHAAARERNFLAEAWYSEFLAVLPEGRRGPAALSEFGDPDGDGISNWLEARLDTDPFERTVLSGVLTREWWFNVPGNTVAGARDAGVFLRKPSMVTHPAGVEGEPDTSNWFASRLRGTILPPATGEYRFWIAGDDDAELWLSENDRKFHKRRIARLDSGRKIRNGPIWTAPREWDRRGDQLSDPVRLEEGKEYFIEILHKEAANTDHVSVAWQFRGEGEEPWSERAPVDASAVRSHPGDDDDLDDDYLPDSWELRYGLDPKDNGSKDRVKQGEDGDFDGDGLANREEFLLGTNPANPDTDGDGVSDYDEVHLYGSNPTVRDASPPVRHRDFAMEDFRAGSGDWFLMPDGTLRSTSRRGPVDFEFELDAAGIYLLELVAVSRSNDHPVPIPVVAGINGAEIGRAEIGAEEGVARRWLTPWLPAGRHTVTIDNRNVRLGVALEISSLVLHRHEGEDLDGNAIPDWMEGLFRKKNRIDAYAASAVSPACLEGSSRFPGGTVIEAGGAGVEVRQGVAGRWFADVPLDPSGETGITAAFENGALREERTLGWSATNLFEAPAAMRVRVGDSLKITAVPPGLGSAASSASLALDGEALGGLEGEESRVVAFARAGRFMLSATATAAGVVSEAAMEVEVVAADFGPAFDLAAGRSMVWDLPGLPHDLALEKDAGLALEEHPRQATESRRFSARYEMAEAAAPRVLARLWEAGPVVAATTVDVYRLVAATESRDVRVVDVLADGTRVVEISFLIDGKVPDGLSIWIEFIVTDAVFADGSTRYQLTAADFDENGVARLRMYKAPGEGIAYICHRIEIGDGSGGESGEGGTTANPEEQ